MKWKNKLKMFLAETAKLEKNEIYPKMPLTITDKTRCDVVSSVIVSDELAYFSKIHGNLPECSNCGLKLEMWEGKLFCAMGCRNSTN